MKNAGLRIRLQRELREEFIEACKAEDKSAAQVLREYMRDYIESRGDRLNPVSRAKVGQNDS